MKKKIEAGTKEKQKNNKIKSICNNNKKLIIIAIIVLLLLIGIIFLINNIRKGNSGSKFALDPIYDVHPDEVKELYSNLVDISCFGDLHLDIKLDDAKETNVTELDKNTLLNYLFSHLDKKELLNDDLTVKLVKDTSKKLFLGNIDLNIDNYEYGNYIYNIKGRNITKDKKECHSDIRYVSYLFGYSIGEDTLSMDVDVGYVNNDGVLYDLSDKNVGKYDPNDIGQLFTLLGGSSYYRFNYVKIGSIYKLKSVEWKSRI